MFEQLVEIVETCSRWIRILGKFGGGGIGDPWQCILIQEEPDGTSRDLFWQYISQVVGHICEPLIVMGDWNVYWSLCEKWGVVPLTQSVIDKA